MSLILLEIPLLGPKMLSTTFYPRRVRYDKLVLEPHGFHFLKSQVLDFEYIIRRISIEICAILSEILSKTTMEHTCTQSELIKVPSLFGF